MFEWTVQTEISKDTCIWSRRSTSLSPGEKWHPGNPRWEVWIGKVVFTWTVLLLNPYKGTSWLLLAPSPPLSSLYFVVLAVGSNKKPLAHLWYPSFPFCTSGRELCPQSCPGPCHHSELWEDGDYSALWLLEFYGKLEWSHGKITTRSD